MEFLSADDYALGRLLFERSLAALYLIAFISALNQFPALLGAKGLLPVPDFLGRGSSFWACPTLFRWGYSDRRFRVVAWAGILLSAAVLFGALALAPLGAGFVAWLVLWFLYLSIVNVGQRFYSFGWESMLVEAGFFAAFLSPEWMEPSWIPIFLLLWMLFRVEVGAGLIKLRAGGPWLDLTALERHHETQPMPNPLSWTAHRLPRPILRFGVLFSHFVQVAAPFGLFFPQPVAGIAAGLIIFHQLLLIAAGNYAWLNWLTIVLALVALPDAWLSGPGLTPPESLAPRPLAWNVVHVLLLGFAAWLSVKPALNLLSKRQLMNYCFNAWHLVNAYGAFGSVTTERHEIVVEGAASEHPGEGDWRPYEFKGKPGDPRRAPPQVAPYHLRLDWLMWFLPLGAVVTSRGVALPGYERWFLRFAEKLLEGDRAMLRLLRENPFSDDEPPRWLRARFFLYRFSTRAEKRETGNVWMRRLVGEYLSPVSLKELKRD